MDPGKTAEDEKRAKERKNFKDLLVGYFKDFDKTRNGRVKYKMKLLVEVIMDLDILIKNPKSCELIIGDFNYFKSFVRESVQMAVNVFNMEKSGRRSKEEKEREIHVFCRHQMFQISGLLEAYLAKVEETRSPSEYTFVRQGLIGLIEILKEHICAPSVFFPDGTTLEELGLVEEEEQEQNDENNNSPALPPSADIGQIDEDDNTLPSPPPPPEEAQEPSNCQGMILPSSLEFPQSFFQSNDAPPQEHLQEPSDSGAVESTSNVLQTPSSPRTPPQALLTSPGESTNYSPASNGSRRSAALSCSLLRTPLPLSPDSEPVRNQKKLSMSPMVDSPPPPPPPPPPTLSPAKLNPGKEEKKQAQKPRAGAVVFGKKKVPPKRKADSPIPSPIKSRGRAAPPKRKVRAVPVRKLKVKVQSQAQKKAPLKRKKVASSVEEEEVEDPRYPQVFTPSPVRPSTPPSPPSPIPIRREVVQQYKRKIPSAPPPPPSPPPPPPPPPQRGKTSKTLQNPRQKPKVAPPSKAKASTAPKTNPKATPKPSPNENNIYELSESPPMRKAPLKATRKIPQPSKSAPIVNSIPAPSFSYRIFKSKANEDEAKPKISNPPQKSNPPTKSNPPPKNLGPERRKFILKKDDKKKETRLKPNTSKDFVPEVITLDSDSDGQVGSFKDPPPKKGKEVARTSVKPKVKSPLKKSKSVVPPPPPPKKMPVKLPAPPPPKKKPVESPVTPPRKKMPVKSPLKSNPPPIPKELPQKKKLPEEKVVSLPERSPHSQLSSIWNDTDTDYQKLISEEEEDEEEVVKSPEPRPPAPKPKKLSLLMGSQVSSVWISSGDAEEDDIDIIPDSDPISDTTPPSTNKKNSNKVVYSPALSSCWGSEDEVVEKSTKSNPPPGKSVDTDDSFDWDSIQL